MNFQPLPSNDIRDYQPNLREYSKKYRKRTVLGQSVTRDISALGRMSDPTPTLGALCVQNGVLRYILIVYYYTQYSIVNSK